MRKAGKVNIAMGFIAMPSIFIWPDLCAVILPLWMILGQLYLIENHLNKKP